MLPQMKIAAQNEKSWCVRFALRPGQLCTSSTCPLSLSLSLGIKLFSGLVFFFDGVLV
jgi:hypothetical protein